MKDKFCIISNNCWGGEVYKDLNLHYNTPFIGLFIPPLCFVKLCNNLPWYLAQDIKFIETSKYDFYELERKKNKYPVALLYDVEIHFQHYSDNEEVIEKWYRRKDRMPKNSDLWFIKGCDREIDNWDIIKKKWNQIPYKKVFFLSNKNLEINGSVWIFESKDKQVTDGKALYKISKNYINIVNWLNGRGIKLNLIKRINMFIRLKIYQLWHRMV